MTYKFSSILHCSFIFAAFAGASSLALFSYPAFAQDSIVPDNTLSEESSQIERTERDFGSLIKIEGGAVRAENLFHSFQEFSIPEDVSAYFANPSGIENIFSRITGDNVSNIFGTLGVEGNANLFILNPNGVVFGPNAFLNIAGSLTISTDSAFDFTDSSRFSSDLQQPSLLTVSAPIGIQAGQSSGLANIESSGSLVVGNDIVLVADRIELQREAITAGGDIQIVANNLEATQGAQLRTSAEGNGGDVDIDVVETVRFDGVNQGIRESGGIFSLVGLGSEGSGGNIRLTANNLELTNGAQIGSGTLGVGDAGDVSIKVAQTARFDGFDQASNFSSGVFSNIDRGGEGTGGNVEITANNLEVTNGAQIVSGALGEGEAGDISIEVAERALFSGTRTSVRNSESTEARRNDSDGEAVNPPERQSVDDEGIEINDEGVEIDDEGNEIIDFDDFDEITDEVVEVLEPGDRDPIGDAFDPVIDVPAGAAGVGAVSEPPGTITNFTGINNIVGSASSGAYSLVDNEQGQGGDISVRAANLNIVDGARLDSSTRGSGDAGSIQIDLQEQLLANDGSIETISQTGRGGSISISAEGVRLLNDGDITTFVPSGTGGGGNIEISSNTVIASGDSDILSFSTEGRGGNITIDTPILLTSNNPISRNATNPAELDGNDRVDINADGSTAGTISIPDILLMDEVLDNLPEGFANATIIAAGSCISPAANPNRFVISGRGGVPVQTGNSLALSYEIGKVRSLSTSTNTALTNTALTNTALFETDEVRSPNPTETSQGSANRSPLFQTCSP